MLTAALATIPSREDTLAPTVASLLPQVDRLFVYLNGHTQLPVCLRHPRIEVAWSADHGDNGDAGKFHWAHDVAGIHLTCDDDIVYPPDYAARLRVAVEERPDCAHGVLGFRFVQPIASYYRSRAPRYAVRFGLTDAVQVHGLGTGTLAFMPKRVRFPPAADVFRASNMADVWFSVWAEAAGVPRWCVARPAEWLEPLPVTGVAIYDEYRRTRDDRLQTETVQMLVWPTLDPVMAHVLSPADIAPP